jgi:4-hydroxybenzoate polyprenyltransferase
MIEEMQLTIAILGSNWTAHCGNSVACLCARFFSASFPPKHLVGLLPGMTIITFVFSYSFDIANQAFSVEEDAINKPDRPVVSGRLAIKGAYARWFLSWILFPVLTYFMVDSSTATILILWEFWVLVFYVWPKVDHWIARNIFTALGAVLQLSLLDAFLTKALPAYQANTSLARLLFSWLVMTIHVQEFHDMEGDRATGRRTLPLLLGPRGQLVLRAATATIMAGTAVVNLLRAHMYWSQSIHSMPADMIGLAGCHLASMIIVAIRLITMRWKEADKVTYKYYYTLATYMMLLFHASIEKLPIEEYTGLHGS